MSMRYHVLYLTTDPNEIYNPNTSGFGQGMHISTRPTAHVYCAGDLLGSRAAVKRYLTDTERDQLMANQKRIDVADPDGPLLDVDPADHKWS